MMAQQALAEDMLRKRVDSMEERREGDLQQLRANIQQSASCIVLVRSPERSGSPTGVGVILKPKPPGAFGPFLILSVSSGGPAARSGKIKAGDYLVGIGELLLYDMDLAEVTKLILGTPGTEVDLWIQARSQSAEPNKNIRTVRFEHSQTLRPQVAAYNCFSSESRAEARARTRMRLARQQARIKCNGADTNISEPGTSYAFAAEHCRYRPSPQWPVWRPSRPGPLKSSPNTAVTTKLPPTGWPTVASPLSLAADVAGDAPEDAIVIGFSTGATVERLMMNDPTLTSLSLVDVVLGEYRTRHVLHVLAEHNTSLTSLKLAGGSGSLRGQEQTQEISRMLQRNTSLRHLCLFGADVSDDDVAILCEAIKGEANSIVCNCYWSGWGSRVD